MSWDHVILRWDDSNDPLSNSIEYLFSCQRRDWQAFREGEAALASTRRKTLSCDGIEVVVQSNPGRRKSTHAKTDSASIAARKCFLCPENMPAEERGIAFGHLVILPNPYPILGQHCTIPDRVHRPQQIDGQLAIMLQLAGSLGPDMVVFYNGPRCGASAPDHFHFQACLAEGIPLLEQQSWLEPFNVPLEQESFGRRFLVFNGSELDVGLQIEQSIEALRRHIDPDVEPMFNLIVAARDEGFQALLFPRQSHRPSCYFAEGNKRIAISPAALEMAGVVVVAEPDQFDRVDADVVRRIYEEVSLDASQFSQLVEAVR